MAENTDLDRKENSVSDEKGSVDRLYEKQTLTGKEKFKNFIYYYKTAIIFSLIVIAIIVFLVIQLVNKVDPDLYFMYAGRYYIDSSSYEEMQKTLGELVGKDFNGDGKVYYEIISKTVKTPEQAEKEQDESDEYLYTGDIAEGMSSFRTEFGAGTSVICFIDEQLYKKIDDKERLVPLSDILGELPEGAIDEYAVPLKSTPFADACPSFKKLSENTVVCIKRRLYTVDEKLYNYHIEAFRTLFGADEK